MVMMMIGDHQSIWSLQYHFSLCLNHPGLGLQPKCLTLLYLLYFLSGPSESHPAHDSHALVQAVPVCCSDGLQWSHAI